jgi:hypothetical protein
MTDRGPMVSGIGHVQGDKAGHRDMERNPKHLRIHQWRGYSRTDRHTNMTKPRLSTFIYTVYSETNDLIS